MRISLRSVFQHNFESQTPFAAFRMPGDEEAVIWIQESGKLFHPKEVQHKKHFIFSPFEENHLNKCFAITADKILKGWDISDPYRLFNTPTGNLLPKLENYSHPFVGYNTYINQVKSLKEKISSDQLLQKVVLSRPIKKELDKNPDVYGIFRKLCEHYSTAFVYTVYHPSSGLWVGATPEIFLKAKRGLIKTMSLAGTQINGHPFGKKEMEEQAFVTEFIIDVLQAQQAQDIRWSKPHKQKAGPVTHLKTEISAQLSGKSRLEKLINSLHPTPAVCGQPKELAMKMIKEVETYNRSYYTGFLGPVREDDSFDLYVNLRCMQIFKNAAALYVGGGITLDSKPEDEWLETEAKSMTLLAVLKTMMHQYA